MKWNFRKNLILFGENAANIIFLSVLTGLFSGIVVTFYNLLVHIGEDKAARLYSLVLGNPAFIPLLFLGLAAGGIVIGTLVRFVPMIRGSGIPQIEGAARGKIRFKWYVTMCSMFAASLACVFLGLSAGAEGPSLEIGGCAGNAVGTLLRRNMMTRRLQTAAGASAGFATAFNAPITGMVFAMEEAFRSFSPQVFISAAVSVVAAVITRNALLTALGQNVGFVFGGFVFAEIDAVSYLWVALASVVTSLVGVGLFYAVFAAKKLFLKVKFFKGTGKYLIPFVLAGAFGLITAYAIGGGHSFISDVASNGTGNFEVTRVFGLGLVLSLLIIVVVRLITIVLYMGCGVPCGVFVPMLAAGAGIGALLSVVFQGWGMNGVYSDYLIMICMAAFFTCIVKAPITAIVMVFELTGSFVNFLPALMGIAIGYLIGMAFRTEPIYERCLEMYIDEENLKENVRKLRVSVKIMAGSKADGNAVRTIIWPSNGLVVALCDEEGKRTVPDGETVLRAGETIDFECETDDEGELLDYLYDVVGKQE